MTLFFRQFLIYQIFHLKQVLNTVKTFVSEHLFLSPLFFILFVSLFSGYSILIGKLVDFIYLQPYFGVMLATKLIQFLFLMAIGLSFVSGLTPSLSTLYLSKDLEIQFPLPVIQPVWMLDRFFSVLFQSSGMILIFGSPFLFHFLSASGLHWSLFLLALTALAMTCAIPVLLTMMGSMALVRIFPVQKIQQVFLVVSIIIMATLVLLFRYMEPEQFIGPGGIERFKGYVDLVHTDKMVWNPAIWAGHFITALSQNEWREAVRYFIMLAGVDTLLFGIFFLWGSKLYRKSWNRALYALSGESKSSGRHTASLLSRFIAHPRWGHEIKETLVFLRDPSQWAQIFVLIALVFLYVFSIRKLGMSGFSQSPLLLAIGNTGFVGFVALSISSRFVFTSFSLEGHALWILQTIPGGWVRYVRSKFLVYGFPVFFFGLLLEWGTSHVLHLSINSSLYLLASTLWDCLLLVGLSTLFGMIFLNPGIDNPLKLIISPGGILLMGTGLFFVLLHVVIRLAGHSELFNFYTRSWGFPNMQNGAEWIWSAGLCFTELFFLSLGNIAAMRRLRTSAK